MRTRKLGRTALSLSELSFGAAGIGNLYRSVSREDAMATLQTAWDAGIRYFDTAPYYGQGLSERRIGDFLQMKPRGAFVLSTKVGRILKPAEEGVIPDYGFVDALPFVVEYDYSYDGIMRSHEQSLARLGLGSVDILYVHDLEANTLGEEAYRHHFGIFTESGIEALHELKAKGKIGAFGLGVNEVPACLNLMEIDEIDCILLAGRYTLLDRSAAARLLGRCAETGTSLIIGGVFNSGILATGARPGATFNYAEAAPQVVERVRAMEAHAADHGVAFAAAALHFPLQNADVASVLIGTAKPDSLRRNLSIFETTVPDAAWAGFDTLALED
ncbi:aldo/keto reductase [Agrobacterium rhizogenes]|uniref:aldo/keto reductase n=1 Tax=Rhizobium rhizogenes TaxID=359 RepID=UPI0022B647CB|nr:aldo/keto reductase [Rhizobium rhizogenes]MCZ7450116.1 aldo/keto reductase [Rhizobium rhizogenes]